MLIDAPPLLPVTDAAIIASKVDGAILVVRHGETSHEQVRMAADRLASVDGRLIAAIVNMTPTNKSGSGYGYGYGYGYAPAPAEPQRIAKGEKTEREPTVSRRARKQASREASVIPPRSQDDQVDPSVESDAEADHEVPDDEALGLSSADVSLDEDPSAEPTEDGPERWEDPAVEPEGDPSAPDAGGWLDASQGLGDEPARKNRRR
ncbi:tyrosine-protein kinase family protein [Aeromicrobium sp. Sec7.5]|uniref:tyrosine-protein kinase family protein n=1 Tax=Aeromicrobium sp. Sec7.5 TaxID=3121276 RepID=UPI002FE49A88